MKICRVAILISLVGVSACSTTPWPWYDRTARDFRAPCPDAACGPDEAQKALSAASSYCVSLVNEYGASKAMVGGSKVAINTLGAVSGGVIAQLAEGSASKAWAGVSGVASGMQSSMDQAFAGAIYVQRKHQVGRAAMEGIEEFLSIDVKDPSKRVDVAMKMALRCAAAAARSDAEVLNAISSVKGPDGQTDQAKPEDAHPTSKKPKPTPPPTPNVISQPAPNAPSDGG